MAVSDGVGPSPKGEPVRPPLNPPLPKYLSRQGLAQALPLEFIG